MSRIVGLISDVANQEDQQLLDSMLLATRLDEAWQSQRWDGGKASLGWTGWHSPELVEQDGILATLDGCFYNREELGQSRSDTELLILLYRKHGFQGALTRINGDFALALHDQQSGELWLGRDRFGIKPLYYHTGPQRFAFASQPRSLLRLPAVGREPDHRFIALFAASHYRYFDNAPEKSPYLQISQLPAAHVLCWKEGRLRTSKYWDLEELPEWTDSEQELAERYRELLIDSVRLRTNQAERPAFTLSGGMDSSSVLASAVHITGKRQQAISTVYDDKTYDESADIHTILEATVEDWHPVVIGTPDVFGCIHRMIEVHDEPVATATWLSHFLLCGRSKELGFRSLFGGLGGDELNAGEYEYFPLFFADLAEAGKSEIMAREIEEWVRNHDHPIFRKDPRTAQNLIRKLTDPSIPGRCLADRNRLMKYADALDPDFYDLRDFEPVMEHPFRSYMKNRTYQDMFRETLPCCLRAQDRQTMVKNLDNYLPFLDHRLVEFMFRVPGALKIRGGVTKRLLRQAMIDILPESTRKRIKKTGWNAPAHQWFSGPGGDLLLDFVHSRNFLERGIYNADRVVQIIDEHQEIVSSSEPRENHMMFLWQLVNLEIWLRSLEST